MADKDELDHMRAMRKRFDAVISAEGELRELAIEDLKFAYDEDGQWEEEVKELRKGRPCYTFNKVRGAIRQVVNDMRQARPGIQVRAVDSSGDPKLAEILSGLVRNIESISNAETAYDTAGEYAVSCGFGAWRVTTQYADDDSFEQDIIIKRIKNPFTVYFDPSAQEYDKRDAKYCFVSESLSKDEFQDRYPKAAISSFESEGVGEGLERWYAQDDTVRIAEYWYKEPEQVEIALLSDGQTIELTGDTPKILDELAVMGVEIVRKRKVTKECVYMEIVSGTEVLEGPYKWPGKFIPVVPVFGEEIDIEGEQKWAGLTRWAKDAQRSYNYHRSTMIELIDLQPKAPWLLTPEMVKGQEKFWQNAHRKNLPFMIYNPDPKAPGGAPRREVGPQIPAAYAQESITASDDIKATTGIYDASLGQRSNETSGKAILARQREGDVATFAFMDNLARSIKYTGEILVDLIPKIYDTERVVRILGKDGAEEYKTLNQTVMDTQTMQPVIVNDITKGKYDVTVTTGPSYTTQRVEAAEQLMNLMQVRPEMAMLLSDIFVKNLDMPYADEIHKRVRLMMIQQGMVEPSEDDELPPPKEPSPQEQMQMQSMQTQLEKLMAEVEKIQVENQAKMQKLQIEGAQAEAGIEKTRAETEKLVEETVTQVIENLARQGLINSPGEVNMSL